MSYLCAKCGKSFKHQSSLTRHIKQSCNGSEEPPTKKARSSSVELNQPGPSGLIQPQPIPSTSRASSNSGQIICQCCNKVVQVSHLAAHRRTLQHRTNACVDVGPGVQLTDNAFRGRIASYRISSDNHHTNFAEFFESIRQRFLNLMMEVLRNHTTVKINMELFGRYIIQKGESQDSVMDVKSFNTTNKIINSSMDLNDVLNMFIDMLTNQTTEFQERDSGWALEHIMYLEVNVNQYTALHGSSYIKLPKFIEAKKAVVNVNNQDQHCFLWAIISALYPPNNRMRHQAHDCNHIRTDMPSTEYRKDKCGNFVRGNILKFDNYEKQMEVPFVVYADFESVLKPMGTCEPGPKISYTYKTYRHEPYSFAYIIKCSFDDSASKFQLYRGADAAHVFVNRLESDVMEIYERYLKHIKFMNPLSKEEQDQFARATNCGICEKPFGVGESKAKDHDHLTGKFRFAAHTNCNLNYKAPSFIPIICHNMASYDLHLFIKQLFSEKTNVDVIAQSKEKYISITKHIHVGSYKDKDGLLKKHKLNYNGLPSRNDFYDKLNDEDVSELDYRRAEKVWALFNCKTLGDYSDIYLKSDVLLLCDVFENFRKICLETYKLDPAQYFTAPGLAWDAMLKLTQNIDMIHMLKKGIRGGISQCSERKHVANNMFVPNYNSEEPSSFIAYLDATNLYGHSMSQLLPTGGFTWVNESDIKNFDVMEVSDDCRYGFVLEVDVDYPEELHDKHTDLPFLAENIVPPSSKSKLKETYSEFI
ncbi:hypothetical protein NQ315_006555 [Exocentrus adspersus]|uniref:C2H2-type domain-containing protein n=1 Tax=Exocentrus adspersus TaxID=1586481 RepID=A0AAV8VFX0_9CUCU|nr:hypothetical protein NQ315_006555 [Exocentrus adspersus]